MILSRQPPPGTTPSPLPSVARRRQASLRDAQPSPNHDQRLKPLATLEPSLRDVEREPLIP